MLDVLHVVVGDGHTNIAKFVNHLFLRILSAVSNSLINAIKLLSESLFSLLSINLTHLLEFKLVLTHEMLFFLGQVTKVVGRTAYKDLAGRQGLSFT
jgi:hypothetical protein